MYSKCMYSQVYIPTCTNIIYKKIDLFNIDVETYNTS